VNNNLAIIVLHMSTAIRKFPVREIIAGNRIVTPEDYLPVTRIPSNEMLAKSPAGIVEELLELMAASGWKSKLRRSLSRGDIVFINGIHWMIIRNYDRPWTKFPEPEFAILPNYKNYCLVRIPVTQINGDLCTV